MPTTTISQFLLNNSKELAEETLARHYQEVPDLKIRYDEFHPSKYIDDIESHLKYLTEAITYESPILFEDYLAWLKVVLSTRNIPIHDFFTSLRLLQDVLAQHLSPSELAIVNTYIQNGIETIKDEMKERNSYLSNDSDIASAYLDTLLQGNRKIARDFVLAAINAGMPITDVYLKIFQRSQYEIGRLWQINKISVAQEHFCSAATQMIMSELYPYIFSTKRKGLKLVSACVGEELHEIGLRIVSDFFELDGWDTMFLGASNPVNGIIQLLHKHRPDVIALSTTMTFHLPHLRRMIETIRSDDQFNNAYIMVGGYPFNTADGLWHQLGANASALDAPEAVRIANHYISNRTNQ